MSRIGMWYLGGDGGKDIYRIVSDSAEGYAQGFVTVEDPKGEKFPMPCDLIDQVASPPGTMPLPPSFVQ